MSKLFIHNPHCAGTAFHHHLSETGELCSLSWPRGLAHSCAREWQLLYPTEWDNLETVAIVRNPYDRLVSMFIHELETKFTLHTQFDSWLFCGNYKSKWPFDVRKTSQTNFLTDFNNHLPNSILKFELDLHFEAYYWREEMKSGLSPKRPHYSKFYTNESIEWVSAFFKDDLENWGYVYESK